MSKKHSKKKKSKHEPERGWSLYYTSATEQHAYPKADIVEHDLNDECFCKPSVLTYTDAYGDLVFRYLHHSVDGRELLERYDEINGLGSYAKKNNETST